MNSSGAGKEMYDNIDPDLECGNYKACERCAPGGLDRQAQEAIDRCVAHD